MAAINHLLLEIVPTVGHLHPQAIDQSRGAAGQLFARCMQRQHARLAMKVRISASAISPSLFEMTLLSWRHFFGLAHNLGSHNPSGHNLGFKWQPFYCNTLVSLASGQGWRC